MERRSKVRRMDDEFKDFIKSEIHEIKEGIKGINGNILNMCMDIRENKIKIKNHDRMIYVITIPAVIGFIGGILFYVIKAVIDKMMVP